MTGETIEGLSVAADGSFMCTADMLDVEPSPDVGALPACSRVGRKLKPSKWYGRDWIFTADSDLDDTGREVMKRKGKKGSH